jgi:hypothetical protein
VLTKPEVRFTPVITGSEALVAFIPL